MTEFMISILTIRNRQRFSNILLTSQYSKHILTDIGESIVDDYGGIEKFLAHRQVEINEKNRLKKITDEKLIFDAKLSKWQVKIFWPMFIIALIGGFYSIYSIIDAVVGESEEQKIVRILDQKLQEREQKQKTSTSQTSIDTLSIYDTDETYYIYS